MLVLPALASFFSFLSWRFSFIDLPGTFLALGLRGDLSGIAPSWSLDQRHTLDTRAVAIVVTSIAVDRFGIGPTRVARHTIIQGA